MNALIWIKRMSVLIAMLFASISYGMNPAPKVRLEATSPKKLVLYVTTLENDVQILLRNAKQELLYSEKLPKGYAYKKTYDISSLSNGVYYVSVMDNSVEKIFCIEKERTNRIYEVQPKLDTLLTKR